MSCKPVDELELQYRDMFDNISECGEIFKTGVYKIYHIDEPDRIYVGSASMINSKGRTKRGFYKRLQSHIAYLRIGKHPAKKFAAMIEEKGIEGLRISILEFCDDRNTCLDREQYYLDTLKPCYNTYSNSRGCKGMPISEETRQRLIAQARNQNRDSYTYDSRKKITYQFDLMGNYIASHKGSFDASVATGTDQQSIRACLLKYKSSAGSFIWSYAPEIQIQLIVQKNIDGSVINKFFKKADVIKSVNVTTYARILKCLRGEQSTYMGYRWEYEIIKSLAA